LGAEPLPKTASRDVNPAVRRSARSHFETGLPPRRPSRGGQRDFTRVYSAADKQPGYDRIRVPHLACVEFVAAPGGGRDPGDESEHALRDIRPAGQPAGAVNRFVDIGDHTSGPAPDLVAEGAQPPAHLAPTGPRPDEPPTAIR